MSGHISYAEENNYETREKFLNNYLLIQNNFFDDIAKTLNISLEDLINAYQTYNGSIEVQFDSSLTPAHYEELKLSCLNAEKNKFVNKIFRSTINNKKLSIREIVNLCKKVNQLTSK